MSEKPGTLIAHGGNLHEAAQRYGIAWEAWIDLSTGINPHGYPVPPVPAAAWRRLPDDGDGFAACAARYYGAPDAITGPAFGLSQRCACSRQQRSAVRVSPSSA